MEYRKQTAKVVAALVATALVTGPTLASAKTRKGNNPNGRPFIELQGQIVEVEGEISSLSDQISSLVGRVESVEEAQASIVDAIGELEAENVDLQAQIAANADDVMSLEGQISALNSEIMTLEQQIADQGDVDGSLQAQIDAHDASVTTLALSIDTLEGDLQASIDNNTALISAMEQEIESIQSSLDLYQLLVSGQCPAGQSIREIAADGSVVCEIDDAVAGFGQYRAFGIKNTANGYAKATATCPVGTILTGGGFWGNFGSSSSLLGWPVLYYGADPATVEAARQFTSEVHGAEYDGAQLFAVAICLEVIN